MYILRPAARILYAPPFYTPPTPRRVFSGEGGWACIKFGPVKITKFPSPTPRIVSAPVFAPTGGDSDRGPRKTRTKTQATPDSLSLSIYIFFWGKEKLRQWSEFLGTENSDYGLSFGCFWGRGRRGGYQIGKTTEKNTTITLKCHFLHLFGISVVFTLFSGVGQGREIL